MIPPYEIFGLNTGPDTREEWGHILRPKAVRDTFIAAYQRLPADRQALIYTTDLSLVIDSIIASAEVAPALWQMTKQSPELRQARMFHRTIAGALKRKFSIDSYQFQHDDSMADQTLAYMHQKFAHQPPVQEVIAWVLHEAEEDYDQSHANIALFAGSAVADRVRGFSIPTFADMKKMYPDLPPKKIVLKNHHKDLQIENYDVYSTVFKFIDSPAALQDFTRNMELGQIHVTNDPEKADADIKNPRGPIPVHYAPDLMENLKLRRAINEKLIAHCAVIQNDPLRNPHNFDCLSMGEDFRRRFADIADAFAQAVGKAAARHDMGSGALITPENPLPTPRGAYRAWMSKQFAWVTSLML